MNDTYEKKVLVFLDCSLSQAVESMNKFNQILIDDTLNEENCKQRIQPIIDFILCFCYEETNCWDLYECFKAYFKGKYINPKVYEKIILHASDALVYENVVYINQFKDQS